MFIESTIQGIADYMGQSLEIVAFLIGLIFIVIFFLSIVYLMMRIGRQALSAPMDLMVFVLGIAIVTVLQWWPPWILLSIIFISIFATIFFRGYMRSD